MSTQLLTKRQKYLAAQVAQFVSCREQMITAAVVRTNEYLDIINGKGADVAKSFLLCQRAVIKLQPNLMEKQIEGAQYLPAARHAFKGVPVPKSQVIKSIEREKQLNMGYLLSSLLPMPVSDAVVQNVVDSNPLPEGKINESMVTEYLESRLKQFLSFQYYQNALEGFENAIQSKKEITFKDYGIRDKNHVIYILDNIQIFDYFYVQQNNFAAVEVAAEQGSVRSNLMTISTGKKLEDLTGIEILPSLRNALNNMLSASTQKAGNASRYNAAV